ncbi:leucine-rich repeat-containing protein 2-like, partial [Scleropages formosus]
MKGQRILDIPVCDLSLIRNLWEIRVKKYRQRQRKEQERIQKSALARINQQWQYRIECKTMKATEVCELQHYLERRSHGISSLHLCQDIPFETGKLYSRNDIPTGMARKLINLRELNASYNKLSSIPPELGDCENLEKLELISNLDLGELPFELSNLKKLTYLDISANRFHSVPICVLRMSSLQWLDISNNLLSDLPQDIDRLQELTSLFLHKNKITYLPMALADISSLKMVVVSGDQIVCLPSRLCEDPAIKFIRLFDNPVNSQNAKETEKETRKEQNKLDEFEKEFMQAYIETIKER